MPLLHTWSLALEEQFYLIVPLLLVGLFRFPRGRTRAGLLAFFGSGIVASLALSIYGVRYMPAAAFYLLPTRAWELLLGSFVALLPPLAGWRTLREVLAWTALLLILVPAFLYTRTTPFPGLAAVPPCLGTAMFIFASSQPTAAQPLPVPARVLATGPLVFVGLISYSLYLWHWPLFAFSRAWALEPLTLWYRLTLIASAIVLASLSWRFVETPFRKRTVCGTKRAVLTFAATAAASVCVAGVVVAAGHGFPQRLPPSAMIYAQAKDDMEFVHELKVEDALAGRFPMIGKQDSNAPISLLIWGDSHAMAAMPAFDALLKERGLTGLQATASATPPILGANWRSEFSRGDQGTRFNQAVLEFILRKRIPNVVLVGFWEHYVKEEGPEALRSALHRTLDRLAEGGTHAWFMLQVPSHTVNVPRALARCAAFGCDLSQISALEAHSRSLRRMFRRRIGFPMAMRA